MEQRMHVENHLKALNIEYVEEAEKYVIDSVHGDKFRLLISKLKEPLPVSTQVEKLADFETWSEEADIIIMEKKDAQKIGLKSGDIEERRVFVRIGSKTTEITEHVRDASEEHYGPLLRREYRRVRRALR